jgi:hypothetical protein
VGRLVCNEARGTGRVVVPYRAHVGTDTNPGRHDQRPPAGRARNQRPPLDRRGHRPRLLRRQPRPPPTPGRLPVDHRRQSRPQPQLGRPLHHPHPTRALDDPRLRPKQRNRPRLHDRHQPHCRNPHLRRTTNRGERTRSALPRQRPSLSLSRPTRRSRQTRSSVNAP